MPELAGFSSMAWPVNRSACGLALSGFWNFRKQLLRTEFQRYAGQGHPLAPRKRVQHPQPIGPFAIAVGAARVEVDHHVFLQCGNAAVVAEFQTPVIGGGVGRQDFGDQLGFGLDPRAGHVERAASDQHVGVKIAVGRSDVQAHVAHKRAARAAAEMLAQDKSQVHGHRHMAVFGTGHRKHFAVEVFMALRLRGFPSQIVGGGEKRFWCGLLHDDLVWRESVAYFGSLFLSPSHRPDGTGCAGQQRPDTAQATASSTANPAPNPRLISHTAIKIFT